MKLISRRRFDALAGYIRRPETVLVMKELAWYEERDETLVGVVGLDTSDGDYVSIILGRDAKKRFRAVDLKHSIPTQTAAAIWLRDRLAELSEKPAEFHYQGDEKGGPVDFFDPIVPLERRAPAFEQLRTQKSLSPALGILRELMHYFEDPDGNFIQQFQSTAFDARLWEVYLYALFTEIGYGLDRTQPVPDFHCGGPLGEFFVEATTLGVSPHTPILTAENRRAYFEEYVPIRFSSALCEKLKKRYWDRPHVRGRPLVLAIQDFHAPGSMTWTSTSLVEYLYGLRQSERDGTVVSEPISRHRWETKDIASHFFALPEAEHISAVIANPSGTLSKFKRMGFLSGFGDRDLKILRRGYAFQGEPFPTPFTAEVSSGSYDETWCEGLAVCHNPDATTPLSPESLPHAGHFTVDDGWLVSALPPFFPVGSQTVTLSGEEQGEAEEDDRDRVD
jgi:hypothetical protein